MSLSKDKKETIKDKKRDKIKKKNRKPYLLDLSNVSSKKKIDDDKKIILLSSRKEFSPLSGSELKYEPNKWNKVLKIKKTHNCYSYALGKIVPGLKSKAQPGYASGFNYISNRDFNCKSFYERLKKDSPAAYLENFDNACMPGFYKIFLALDPMNDYHWYVQNSNKFWSHKPGSSHVRDLDAGGKKIKNPLLSDRKFKFRNYFKPCFFACIYSDLSRSLDVIYK